MFTSISVRRMLTLALVAWAMVAFETISNASEADNQFAVAAGHYSHQDWKLAVTEFRAFLAAYPNEPQANECLFFLGEALRQLGNFDDARQQFQTYIRREPKGRRVAAAMFGAAEAAYLAGDYRTAKSDLTAFREKYPDDALNAFTLPYLGDIALAKSDAAAAITHYRDALQRFPNGRLQDESRFGLGRALHAQNQLQEAERLYAAVAGKPESRLADGAQFYLGVAQFDQEKYDEAIVSFSAFEGRLAKSPWQANARLNRGLALLKLNRPSEAIKQLDAAMAIRSDDEGVAQQASLGKIQAALQLKDYVSIDRDAAQFEKRFPKSPQRNEVRRMLARSLIERKESAQAVPLLEALVADIPAGSVRQQDLESQYLLALGYEGMARYDEALKLLQPVAEKAGGSLKSEVQLHLGTLLMARKRPGEAAATFEAFLAGKPSGDVEAKALAAAATCHARAKQIDKAKQRYAELLEKYPQHALITTTTERLADAAFDANDTAWAAELSKRLASAGGSDKNEFNGKLKIGWSQYKAGQLPEAAATLDELLKKHPPEAVAAEAALLRGRILQELGQNEPALDMYKLVIERCPGSDHRSDALLAAARLQAKWKQPDAAAASYQRLANEYPQFAKLDAAIYDWAWLMQDRGKPDDAKRLFQQLHDKYPQSRFWADTTCRLAQQAIQAKDYQQAGALVDEVLGKKSAERDAGQPDAKVREYALSLCGEIATAKDDWTKVREAFESLIKDYPNSQRRTLAEYQIADSHYQQGDYAAAIERYERLESRIKNNRDPWTAIIRWRHAQALAKQKRWEDAEAIAARIEKDFPDFKQQYEVDFLLGRCYASQGRFDDARQAYKKAIRSAAGEKTETAAMAQWHIGETYFHQKNYAAALGAYSGIEFVYDYPKWQALGLLQAGKCRELLGEPEKAKEAYQRILKSYSKTPFAKDAREQLARLQATTSPH